MEDNDQDFFKHGLSTAELGILYGALGHGPDDGLLEHLCPRSRAVLAPRLAELSRGSEDERALARRRLLPEQTLEEDLTSIQRIIYAALSGARGTHLDPSVRAMLESRMDRSGHGLDPCPPQVLRELCGHILGFYPELEQSQCVPGEKFHMLSLLQVDSERLPQALQHMGLFLFAAMVRRQGARYIARARHEVGLQFADHLERYVRLEHHLTVDEVERIQAIYVGMNRFFPAVPDRLARLGIYLLARGVGERFVEVLSPLQRRLGSPLGEALKEYYVNHRRRPSTISDDVAGRAFLNFPIHDFIEGEHHGRIY